MPESSKITSAIIIIIIIIAIILSDDGKDLLLLFFFFFLNAFAAYTPLSVSFVSFFLPYHEDLFQSQKCCALLIDTNINF